MKILPSLLIFLFFGTLHAQKMETNLENVKFYADVMTNASEANHRQFAFDNLQSAIQSYISSEEFSLTGLSEVKHLKVLPIGNARLVSYQVLLENSKTKSEAFILSSNRQIQKFTPSNDLQDIEFEALDPTTKWVEGLYYFVHPFYQKDRKDTSYLLFSYSQVDQFTKQKMLDVLYFEEGKPVLGNESFVFPKEGSRDFVQNRLIFNYSADMVMSIAYIPEKNRIVLDHLMDVKGRMPGQKSARVPDGTYDAFIYDGTNWVFEDLLYDNLNRAENSKGKSKVKRDLFGREQK